MWSAVDCTDQRAAQSARRVIDDPRQRLRELTGFAADLVVAPTRLRREPGNAHGRKNLVLAQRRGECARHPIGAADSACCTHSFQSILRAQQGHQIDPVGGRIGVSKTAAERPAVTNGAIGDAGCDLAHEPAGRIGHLAVLDRGMRGIGAKPDRIGFDLAALQRIDGAHIHE